MARFFSFPIWEVIFFIVTITVTFLAKYFLVVSLGFQQKACGLILVHVLHDLVHVRGNVSSVSDFLMSHFSFTAQSLPPDSCCSLFLGDPNWKDSPGFH